jgi:NADH-quinone oxidoreductase subunit J
MTGEQVFADIGFYLVAGVILLSALGVLFARRVVHAALALLPCLLGVAALYALLTAHFLFAVQILIYAGAITVLILFAVMLLQRILGGGILAGSHNLLAGVMTAGAMFVVLLAALLTTRWPVVVPAEQDLGQGNVARLGVALLTEHVLVFEAISVVLLAAIVGAVVLARKRAEGE